MSAAHVTRAEEIAAATAIAFVQSTSDTAWRPLQQWRSDLTEKLFGLADDDAPVLNVVLVDTVIKAGLASFDHLIAGARDEFVKNGVAAGALAGEVAGREFLLNGNILSALSRLDTDVNTITTPAYLSLKGEAVGIWKLVSDAARSAFDESLRRGG